MMEKPASFVWPPLWAHVSDTPPAGRTQHGLNKQLQLIHCCSAYCNAFFCKFPSEFILKQPYSPSHDTTSTLCHRLACLVCIMSKKSFLPPQCGLSITSAKVHLGYQSLFRELLPPISRFPTQLPWILVMRLMRRQWSQSLKVNYVKPLPLFCLPHQLMLFSVNTAQYTFLFIPQHIWLIFSALLTADCFNAIGSTKKR